MKKLDSQDDLSGFTHICPSNNGRKKPKVDSRMIRSHFNSGLNLSDPEKRNPEKL